jgi:hypothetical protein
MNVFVAVPDVCTEGADAVHLDPLGGQVEEYAETAQGTCDPGQRRPRIDERGQGHIARRAANGLEMNVNHRKPPDPAAIDPR